VSEPTRRQLEATIASLRESVRFSEEHGLERPAAWQRERLAEAEARLKAAK